MSEADPLDEAFAVVLADWDSDEAHKRFVVLAQTTGRLAEAGKRYRDLKDREPEKPGLQKRLDALVAAALADLATRRPKRDDRPRQRVFWVAVGVTLMIVATALWQLSHR